MEDRSDENDINMVTAVTININYTAFTQCIDMENNPGVMCGDKCLLSYAWCNAECLQKVHERFCSIYRPNIDPHFEKYVAIIDQNHKVSEKYEHG